MSIRVLLVDDSATVRKLVAIPLKEEGFEVLEAADGAEGIAQIQNGGVNCVICDLNLPNKNGIQVIEEIKREPRFHQLPIVILSNEMSDELVGKAKLAGGCGWLLKPCDPAMIVSMVKKLVGREQPAETR